MPRRLTPWWCLVPTPMGPCDWDGQWLLVQRRLAALTPLMPLTLNRSIFRCPNLSNVNNVFTNPTATVHNSFLWSDFMSTFSKINGLYRIMVYIPVTCWKKWISTPMSNMWRTTNVTLGRQKVPPILPHCLMGVVAAWLLEQHLHWRVPIFRRLLWCWQVLAAPLLGNRKSCQKLGVLLRVDPNLGLIYAWIA